MIHRWFCLYCSKFIYVPFQLFTSILFATSRLDCISETADRKWICTKNSWLKLLPQLCNRCPCCWCFSLLKGTGMLPPRWNFCNRGAAVKWMAKMKALKCLKGHSEVKEKSKLWITRKREKMPRYNHAQAHTLIFFKVDWFDKNYDLFSSPLFYFSVLKILQVPEA